MQEWMRLKEYLKLFPENIIWVPQATFNHFLFMLIQPRNIIQNHSWKKWIVWLTIKSSNHIILDVKARWEFSEHMRRALCLLFFISSAWDVRKRLIDWEENRLSPYWELSDFSVEIENHFIDSRELFEFVHPLTRHSLILASHRPDRSEWYLDTSESPFLISI